jgi:hypothetical protein
MNTYSKIKFWSLPVVGAICILIGGYLFPFGPEKRPLAELLMLAGIVQFVFFVVWYFIRVRRKSKETANT